MVCPQTHWSSRTVVSPSCVTTLRYTYEECSGLGEGTSIRVAGLQPLTARSGQKVVPLTVYETWTMKTLIHRLQARHPHRLSERQALILPGLHVREQGFRSGTDPSKAAPPGPQTTAVQQETCGSPSLRPSCPASLCQLLKQLTGLP